MYHYGKYFTKIYYFDCLGSLDEELKLFDFFEFKVIIEMYHDIWTFNL
jgi:hypothetical protein